MVPLFAWQEVLQLYCRPALQKKHWDSHKSFLVSGHIATGLMASWPLASGLVTFILIV